MKRSPYDQQVLDRMAPGALCAEGFLGHDPRDLSDIIAADDAAVAAAGLIHTQIAAKLAEWMLIAITELGRAVELTDNVTGVWREGMGRIPSPWPGEGVFPKGELQLTDRRTGRAMLVTQLSVHLIGTHGFYQGRGSPYRIEPAELIPLLELA